MAVIYSDSAQIPSFGGINQSGDGYNMSMRYATDMYNVDVTGGSFAPMRKGTPIRQKLSNPIGTLACLSRRFGVPEDEKNLLVAFSHGQVLTKLLDHNDDWVVRYSGLSTDNNDYVTYEMNVGDATVDVLLFTNAIDGMFCLWGSDYRVEAVPTPYKFGVIARHKERIWGSGITDYPDSLVYSAPYNPYDWAQNDEIPEDGAGEIMQPTWDGDSFVALRSFGNQLLAFKRGAVFRVYGADPGQFNVSEQYGGGALVENTVAISSSYAMMLGYGGLLRYDGATTAPFQQEAVRTILQERLNTAARDKCTACMKDEKTYLLALPLDGSPVNNAVLEYNSTQVAFSLRRDINVKAFLRVEDRVLYTSATAPGQVFELDGKGDVLPLRWEGGFQDLGMKSSVKSAFTVYFIAEADAPFELRVGIRTEKKLKMKRLTVKPGKVMRSNINVQGRYFRLEIESDTVVPFRITGGVKIDMELDPD